MCKELKSIESFTKNRSKKDGLESQCRECRRKIKSEYRSKLKNQEKERTYRSLYNVKNREKEKLRSRERRKCPEYREYMRKYRENNRELYRKANREYWERNREQETVRIHLYNARIKGLKAEWTVKEMNEMISHFNGKCAISGLSEDIEFDHFIPLASGHAGTFKGNMIILNASINQSKGSKNPFDWIKERSPREKASFNNVVEYLATINKMSIFEFEEYVQFCFESENKILS